MTHVRQPSTGPDAARLLAGSQIRRLRVLLLVACFVPSFAANALARDPGLRFELDRSTYRVVVEDLSTGEVGPEIVVAIGSPAHPTPAGEFELSRVIRDPRWSPGPTARAFGARPSAAGPDGPMGIAKIPITGAIFLHGGGNRFSIGKPITLGCLRATDASIAALLDWLRERGALSRASRNAAGERWQRFTRPTRMLIR